MPLEFGIWRIDQAITKLSPTRLNQESKLEDVIEQDISLIDSNLMIIGRQVATDYGKRIDLLAIDGFGELVVVEIKRDRTPREIVAQLLDYAAWITSLTYDDITSIHRDYLVRRGQPTTPFEQAFAEAFGENPPDTLNESHRLLVVASELDDATERIITYLSGSYGVPINVAFFRYFEDAGREYLARAWLIDPTTVEASSSHVQDRGKARESWNGRDYYVSFGESDTRRWEDARTYGFVCGGGGKWYIRTLSQLTPGKRVFVHIPKVGYVGVGEVIEGMRPVDEFQVTLNGKQIPILEAPLEAPQVDKHADDPEKIEHLVRVDWIKTLPKAEAIWEDGFFGNQNTACKLRNKYTLDTLIDRFGLEE